jgi:hypothetical protein
MYNIRMLIKSLRFILIYWDKLFTKIDNTQLLYWHKLNQYVEEHGD